MSRASIRDRLAKATPGDTEDVVVLRATDLAALLAVADAAELSRNGMGSLLWVANNLHNHKTETFREFMEAALEDWRKGYDALAAALAALEAQP